MTSNLQNNTGILKEDLERSTEEDGSRYNKPNLRKIVNQLSERLCDGVKVFIQRIKTIPSSLNIFNRLHNSEHTKFWRWNMIFLFSCVVAILVDPLFLYIPWIDDNKKCLRLDRRLGIIAIVLRSLSDLFYVIHITIEFRSGSSQGPEGKEAVQHPGLIAKKYILSYFIIDVLAILPLPQVLIFVLVPVLKDLTVKEVLIFLAVAQYVPRVARIYPLYKQITGTSGVRTETAWPNAAFNLLLYMIASHVLGAMWYFFSIQREIACWKGACENHTLCMHSTFYCDDNAGEYSFLNDTCPVKTENPTIFDFGIFHGALQSGIVETTDFPKKLFHCFRWGLQNLSAFGQNLQASTYVWENVFVVFIIITGLVLFLLLIGNMQTYLQFTTIRQEEMRAKKRELEIWMTRYDLPNDLRKRVRRYEQYKWQETRGVDVENLLQQLPKDVRSGIKRHLSLNLLKKVPMFKDMGAQLLESICDLLKPLFFSEGNLIVKAGDQLDEMIFVAQGKVLSICSTPEYFSVKKLKSGYYCGEELFLWALETDSKFHLPHSTKNIQAFTRVEAFSLAAEDLRNIVFQFRRRYTRRLPPSFRYYSRQWQSLAAQVIQAAWRRYCMRKMEEALTHVESTFRSASNVEVTNSMDQQI